MPNIAKALKDEISRIARKESKAATTPARMSALKLRKDVAGLKRRLSQLEQAVKSLGSFFSKMESVRPAPTPEPAVRVWFSGKGIKSLRKKLGLSQADFAKLVGVSALSVYNWEKKPGTLKLREQTKTSLVSARGMGARDAKKRLEEIAKAAKA